MLLIGRAISVDKLSCHRLSADLSDKSYDEAMYLTLYIPLGTTHRLQYIECEGWRQHSSLIFLILLFTKPNIEVSGWLYQTKTQITYIVYQPFLRVKPPNYIALSVIF